MKDEGWGTARAVAESAVGTEPERERGAGGHGDAESEPERERGGGGRWARATR
jgi:hypothetical protein